MKTLGGCHLQRAGSLRQFCFAASKNGNTIWTKRIPSSCCWGCWEILWKKIWKLENNKFYTCNCIYCMYISIMYMYIYSTYKLHVQKKIIAEILDIKHYVDMAFFTPSISDPLGRVTGSRQSRPYGVPGAPVASVAASQPEVAKTASGRLRQLWVSTWRSPWPVGAPGYVTKLFRYLKWRYSPI